MAKSIPLTHFSEYEAAARAIQQTLGTGTPSAAAAVRQAVVDLADLAVLALEEINQVIEGLAMVVLALHPDLKRTPPARRAPSRARR